jgi:hypothetical protein
VQSVITQATAAGQAAAAAAKYAGLSGKNGKERNKKWVRAHKAEEEAQCALLRDIFGNPYYPTPTVDPFWLAWNNGTVRHLARAVYEERELPSGKMNSGRLAVLADALEEAGCGDDTILAHCRQAGTVHVRSCWVVDCLLGKG